MGLRTPPLRAGLLLFSLLGSLAAAPKLRLSNTAVGPISIAAGANGPAQIVEAYNAGDGALNLRVTSSVSWLSATLGAAGPCRTVGQVSCLPIQLALQTSSLARGLATGTVAVSDPNAVDAPQTITVTVALGGNVPDRMDLYVAPNGSSASGAFSTNSWVPVSVSESWLALVADGVGSYRFGMTYHIVARHQAGMGEGDYNGSFSIAGSSFASDNRRIPVTMHVTARPIVDVPARLGFRIAQSTPKQAQGLAAGNRGVSALNITGVTASTSSGGGWLTAAQQQGAWVITADPAGLSAGRYQGSLALATNAVNGNPTVPVDLEVVPQSAPVAAYRGAVSNATFDGDNFVAPGDIMAVFGEQFTYEAPQQAGKVPLDTQLGKTRVLVNGQATPLYYTSYGQVNFQLPFETPAGDALVRVERDGQPGNIVSVRVRERSPHILPFGDYGIIVNQDGSFPMPATPGVPSHPAHPGDVVVIYATGLGATDPPVATGAGAPLDPLARVPVPTRVSFGEWPNNSVQPAQFVGQTPTFVGLYQVNVAVPEDAPRGARVPLYLDLGPVSNRVMIAIE